MNNKPFKKRRPRKFCKFCKDSLDSVDYKDIDLLRRYMNDKGKISPARSTGNCAKHQRMVSQAIKRARNIALMPYTVLER